ncbi:MAG: magnesium transporter [Planctomycetes bacterium]|nr:magnesium transporter [Planctomycetota bacterium]
MSIQSLTLALQAAHRRRSAWSQISGRLGPERTTGLLLGLATGLLVAMAAWLWHQQAAVAACIALGIALAVTTAALFGLAVPNVVRAIQRDPKVAAGPIVLALADIAALFYYFNLARWFLG